MREEPDDNVVAWLQAQAPSRVFLTAVSGAELRYGMAVRAKDRRKDRLLAAMGAILTNEFHARILPFDVDAAGHYAAIGAMRRKAGRPISTLDCEIAAIARSRGAAVATRTICDFEECGIDLIDPWTT